MTNKDPAAHPLFNEERAFFNAPENARVKLVQALQRNPPGSVAAWDALGEFVRSVELEDNAKNRSAVAFFAQGDLRSAGRGARSRS